MLEAMRQYGAGEYHDLRIASTKLLYMALETLADNLKSYAITKSIDRALMPYLLLADFYYSRAIILRLSIAEKCSNALLLNPLNMMHRSHLLYPEYSQMYAELMQNYINVHELRKIMDTATKDQKKEFHEYLNFIDEHLKPNAEPERLRQ